MIAIDARRCERGRRRPIPLFFFLLLVLAGSGFSDESIPVQYWQLTFSYDPQTLRLLKAETIAPMKKSIRTPGLTGAPGTIDYSVDWLDQNDAILKSTATTIPLGMRAALASGQACRIVIPKEGAFVARLDGPLRGSQPRSVRLRRLRTQGLANDLAGLPTRAFSPAEMTLPIELLKQQEQLALPPPGPQGVQKIQDTGPDSNRLVLAVMGDGYTSASLAAGDFTTHGANLLAAFLAKSPWDVYFAGTNVYRIDVESNELGADREIDSMTPIVDTYFNSSFWTSGIQRLLTVDSTGYARAYSAADTYVGPGVWDDIFIIVNSTTYGGSGGAIGVASINPASADVTTHEYGHTFARLADEYESPYPGYPPGDPEPNVDFDFMGPGLKWLIWVDGGTPLPTPETVAYGSVVGAFEGARYLTTGIYRPWFNCSMRSLGVEFCPVCKEAHVLTYFSIVSLIDGAAPPVGSAIMVPGGGATISVTPLPLPGMTYEWSLDAAVLSGQTAPSVTLFPPNLGGAPRTLTLNMEHVTSLVRKQRITGIYTWSVAPVATPTPNAAREWTIYE